jgi:hypothetical protein
LSVTRVGDLPGPIAITRDAIWTANYGSDDVSRYDLRTHSVDTRGGIAPGQPFDIVFDRYGDAWITTTAANDQPAPTSVVVRLEAGTGGTSPGHVAPSHVEQVRFPLPFAGLEALGGNDLWVIVGGHGPVTGDNRVAIVDVDAQGVSRVLDLDESATSVAYGYDTFWVGTYGGSRGDSEIEAFRPGRAKPGRIVVDAHDPNWGPVSIAAGDGAVWALTCCTSGNKLLKIDPITLRIVDTIDLSAFAVDAVAVGAGGVWIESDHDVTKIDPETDKIVHTFPLVHGNVGQLCGIAATRTELWVTSGDVYCDTIGS